MAMQVRIRFTHLYEGALEPEAQRLIRMYHNFMIHP